MSRPPRATAPADYPRRRTLRTSLGGETGELWCTFIPVSGAAVAILVGLIGLVGVIAGSVLTGWLQVWQARADRKRKAEVVARVIYADIERAWQQLNLQLKEKLPVPEDPDIGRFRDAWNQSRAEFAAGVGFDDFHTVAAAFAAFDTYIYYLATEPKQFDRLRLIEPIEALEKARPVAWKAGGGAEEPHEA